MARTKTPTREHTPTTPDTPPEPPTQEQARPSPVLAWPAEWPLPELPAETEKRRRTRGLPVGPALAGAGNATTLTATAAYSAGGPLAAAATGVVVAVAATAAVARRRGAVRRSVAARSVRATNFGATRSGGGSGRSSGSVARGPRSGGAGRSGTGGGATRGGSGSRSGSGRSGGGATSSGLRSGQRHFSGSGGGRSGGGLLRKHRDRHTGPDRRERKLTPRQQKKAIDKAVKKSLKNADKHADKHAAQKTTTPNKSQTLKAAAGRAGRAARSAWTTAKPHAARAARATARQARRAGAAIADGARAVGAGLWTWLRRRDTAAALDRLKNVWRRRKQRHTPDTPTTPAVADTVRRPTNTSPNSTSTGGTMSGGGHHFVAPAMELARAAAHYQPQGMLQVGADFAGLEEALRLHAEAMKTTVENADATQPLAPQIIELMRQIHGLQLKAAELASELQPAFRQLHDVDITRLENPRKGIAGERMWDVSSNL